MSNLYFFVSSFVRSRESSVQRTNKRMWPQNTTWPNKVDVGYREWVDRSLHKRMHNTAWTCEYHVLELIYSSSIIGYLLCICMYVHTLVHVGLRNTMWQCLCSCQLQYLQVRDDCVSHLTSFFHYHDEYILFNGGFTRNWIQDNECTKHACLLLDH